MRDIYYQSVGNPVQSDRLPLTRPATALRSRPASAADRFALTLAAVTIAILAGAIVIIFYRPPGLAWLEPYDLLFALPIILAVLSVWAFTGQFQRLLHPAFLLAVVIVCVNHRMPWGLQVVIVSVTTGLLLFAFGYHAVTISTAPPVPRQQADAIRDSARRQLLMFSIAAALLVAAMLWFTSPLLKLAFVTLPLAAILFPRPRQRRVSRVRVCCASLGSWFSYEARAVPGLLQSPVGSSHHRIALTVFAAILMGIILIRWADSPLPRLIELGTARHDVITKELDDRGAGQLDYWKQGSLTWGVTFALIAILPVVIPLALAVSVTMPAVLDAASESDVAATTNETQSIVDDIRNSPDLTERHSLYLGRVVEDGSPVLVPRDVFREHAHGLGDSGSGKTSLFLCPLIEQLVMSGDCSVNVLDLKSDTLELLATLESAAQRVRRERGVRMPLKFFSNQADRATFAFNPMKQPSWSKFDLLTRTDILCGATGLTYGTDYGQGYYSSANAAVLYHALKTFPHVDTFYELADCIGNVITVAKKRELHPEIRKAGVHVHEVIKRLAACEALNVTGTTGHDADVVDQAIDLSQVFQEPQLNYFHLSATLSPSGAPEIARLVNYMLLAASTQTERKHQVFLIIDEFQRMVASNLEYMLQLARSMGVGVILANQSMEDLKKSTINLIPAVEANCRLRQWFSVSSSDDQQRLIRGSGETVDISYSRTVSDTRNGQRTSYSESEQVVNRFTLNDVLTTSDHPFRSFLRISRGAGYAQYGGLPIILESNYHISAEEYQRRRSMTWPEPRGTFIPAEQRRATATDAPKGPVWTQEVIGETDDSAGSTDAGSSDTAAIDEFFDQFKQTMKTDDPRRRRPKR